MNLIKDLGDYNCLFFPQHESFKYNRIGRKKIAKGSTLSDEDKKRLSEAVNVEEARMILKDLESKNVDLKFVNTNPNAGYDISDVVWNEERANLSIRVKYEGKVALPSNKFGLTEVDSYKYNTYSIVKDGLVNVEHLPINFNLDVENF